MNVDEDGLHTLFISDAYERVYPRVIGSLEILGINIISADRNEGVIKVSLNERNNEEKSFFDDLMQPCWIVWLE